MTVPWASDAQTLASLMPMMEAAGDLLDRLVTLDLKGRGAVDILYRAARARAQRSLTMRAAIALKDRVTEGSVAILCTGFPVRPWISPGIGETDGLPGVAALARAIATGLRGFPFVTAPAAISNRMPQSRSPSLRGSCSLRNGANGLGRPLGANRLVQVGRHGIFDSKCDTRTSKSRIARTNSSTACLTALPISPTSPAACARRPYFSASDVVMTVSIRLQPWASMIAPKPIG
jgi:hypothetical protein